MGLRLSYGFDQAVAHLRDAGYLDHLAHGLIHRAAFFRQSSDFSNASADLDESLGITTRSHMRLHEADAHLERARLLRDKNRPVDARVEPSLAQKIIVETGYGRRVPEAEALAKELESRKLRGILPNPR